ncbi:MAG: SufS family cysteine desulfurase [Bacteroidetes bacterium]|nr:SufS family cysteine desulfurase [Bacteroidota bacterium]
MPTSVDSAAPLTRPFDVTAVRAQFPTLQRTVHGDKPLVYLDNAATSQKPDMVIDRIRAYYAEENSNVHRGVHRLSQMATDAYEGARENIARFINAAHTHEVIFTRGTTEGINLVAYSLGASHLSAGDEIIVSEMEHHSNIVPWQMLCQRTGAKLRVIPVSDAGELDYDAYTAMLGGHTGLVAIGHISNALGTINPVQQMIADAHAVGALALVDGAQSTQHTRVDVQALDCDFFCFSGHKMFGPTGIGVLYGKEDLLNAMPPFQGGGDMIDRVSFEGTTYDALPHKFEAGTPHIEGAIGLGAAVDFLEGLDMNAVQAHEADLLAYATEQLQTIDGLRIIGTAQEKASVISFLVGDAHPYDVGTLLDQMGIAVRTGHHCTEPLMDRYGIPGTVRASFALYNTRADVDRLVQALQRIQPLLS